jgi:integrase
MYTRALENGRLDEPGGLSPQTVLHHHRLLHRALEQAVKWQLLVRNPCDAVEPPTPAPVEMRALTGAESIQLLQAAEGTPLFLPVVLGSATGMRRGEICALKWEDVDVKRGVVTVRRSLEETRAGLVFKSPKTRKGQRTFSLPDFAVEVLVRHRAAQEETRRLMGTTYQDLGLVVTD